MERWGNLLFRLETQDLDWCSRAGLAAAVRNLLCLPAHFDVPGLVTAFRCHKAHRNYIKKHTTAPRTSRRDSHILIKSPYLEEEEASPRIIKMSPLNAYVRAHGTGVYTKLHGGEVLS